MYKSLCKAYHYKQHELRKVRVLPVVRKSYQFDMFVSVHVTNQHNNKYTLFQATEKISTI